MHVTIKIIIEGALIIAVFAIPVWLLLIKSRNKMELNLLDVSPVGEELEDHAIKIAIKHSISSGKNLIKWPLPRINDNYEYILSVYKDLNVDIQKKYTVPASAEWLLDNFYIIEEHVKGLRRDLNKKSYSRLPILKTGLLKGYARIFAVALELVAHTDGQIDDKILSDYLKAYQSHSVLSNREIWEIPILIRIALIENVRHICENIKNTQVQWHKADEIYEDWMANEKEDTNRIIKLFKGSAKIPHETNAALIEHLFYRLRRSGRNYTNILRTIDENLSILGETTENITQKEHNTQSVITVSIGNCMTSLRSFSTMDWSDLLESASYVEQILIQDPDGTYPLMDHFTRNHYRSSVSELALAYGVSELHIAREAVELARKAHHGSNKENSLNEEFKKRCHVGYYLVGKGVTTLKERQKKDNNILKKSSHFGEKYPGIKYIGFICLITIWLIVIVIAYIISLQKPNTALFSILAGIIVLIPASEIAVNIVNWIVCKVMKPDFFARMELKNGIPEILSTIIAVPTLLPDEKRVEELIGNLESHYLSNRENNLYFALIGAFRDSDYPSREDDDDIIETALRGIKELNNKYSKGDRDIFYFFHRESQYNEKNNKWIGWERKRGALLEFNDLVLGSTNTSFSYFSSNAPPFSNIKYIITLDSDTILPMGMAKKMIGTMAHPLNRPVVDKQKGIVIDGYGLMQPRIDVDIESSNKSLFSKIFTGQEGIDPYSNAISDVYQDLFGEGIFTGKGIYDLRIFQSVLKDTFPENAILSHDLLEGSYLRTGLVNDLRLVDSYPSKYNSFASRLHRWVRGDWQLSPLLFGKMYNNNLKKISNPLSLLSRWKIMDNLRRSLVAPALMILAASGLSILPGSIFFWLGFFIFAQSLPFITAFIAYMLSGKLINDMTKRHMPVMFGLKAVFIQGILTLIFLPYQAWLMMDAILVTLARVFITKKNLLEWVTSADVEKSQKNSLESYIRGMTAAFWESIFIVILVVLIKPSALIASLIFLVIWFSSPFIAWWVGKDQKDVLPEVSETDMHELGRIARKTWRYFEEFINAKNSHLAPDNYQADPPRGIANRTSPTNIGLGLLATLSARDFGYIGTREMMDLIGKTVSTIEELEKWNGHLYNWYDTHTLKPLHPAYISTVDSGNFVGYLITLQQGLSDYIKSPIVGPEFSDGIRDTLQCTGKDGLALYETLALGNMLPGNDPVDVVVWNQTLNELISGNKFENIKEAVWKIKIERMIIQFKKEIRDFMPGIILLEKSPSAITNKNINEDIASGTEELIRLLKKNVKLKDLPLSYINAADFIGKLIENIEKLNLDIYNDGLVWLYELKETLIHATETTGNIIKEYEELINRINIIIKNMKFAPLYVKRRQLFSIGFDVDENKLTNSYYDLLASEARLTSYICIAKGEIPPTHWFKMGRTLTVVDGYKGLVSWTGTMFEYLMPILIMKSYKNTLLDETYSFVIKSQKKYGREKNMPWGMSESGFNSIDNNLDYQYKAIGVPWLGLKRGLIEDAVAAPYATFLALLIDPVGAIQNIKRLKEEGLDGPYGFYESVDYTPERLLFETKRAIVKSFMAHHQGMSLLALNNYKNKNIMQKRFNADPEMNAARLLLQEKVPANLLLTKENKEKIVPLKETISKEKSPQRIYNKPDLILQKAHILSNGNYSIMITDRGTGYSKNKVVSVSRWREDSTLDQYGMFFYLRDVESNYVWSATYSPLNVMPDKYEVSFMPDKAIFKRTDGKIETKTEVIVASGDNAEIRRISLKNYGDKPCIIEVTSYFEVILATQAADIAHPAFSNLFIETDFQTDRKCIIANRRSRSETDKCMWIANAAVIEGDSTGDIQYETDRMQILGRGNNVKNPIGIERGKPLSNTVGPVLDPVMSLRVKVNIEPGKTAKISFVTAVSESNELLLSIIDKYTNSDSVEGAFRFALARSQVEMNYLNLGASEIKLYQEMISHILFISPMKRINQELSLQNKNGQSSLWRYGISGDMPIALVTLNRIDRVQILYEVLKAHEYWRLMDLKVDLVILSEEEYGYTLPLYSLITDIVLSRQTHDILKKPGDVFILDKNKISLEDVNLLDTVARVILKGDGRSMEEQVNTRREYQLPKIMQFTDVIPQYETPEDVIPDLLYFNGQGGFTSDRSEYIIRLEKGQNTPAPWINVIANQRFGFIVSEAGSGYTWYSNSRENKLTPWNNDAVSDSPGEAIYINDEDIGRHWSITSLPIREEEPYTIKHGFGYSIFGHTSNGIEQKLTQFVPVDETVKISIVNLLNISNHRRHLSLTYYIRPILGVTDQQTAMYIKTGINESGDLVGGLRTLLIENSYNEEFPGAICFMDTSLIERSVTSDRKEFFGTGDLSSPDCLKRERLSGTLGTGFDPCGAIQVKITLEPNENRDIVFLLGMAPKIEEVNKIALKYRKVYEAKEALANIKRFWKKKMDLVQVETPTVSMNIMLDGWLQYQIISCRMWARSAFYQSGGAFGFRDQLQDSLSIAHLWPEISRNQILLHARHQFIQGDVQHWWHEPQGNGTRTHFSDDRLWLPYVTAEYIRIAGDNNILNETMTYLEDEALAEFEDERYGKPIITQTTSTLYEHCIRAVDISLKLGRHGLPLIGSGDWNDGMNTVGKNGMGESVWLGWFLCSVLELFATICKEMGDNMRAEKYSEIKKNILEEIEKNAWDGNWYIRAYFDNGQPLGSVHNSECKIDSIAQSWSVISGFGETQRKIQAMNSLDDYLVDREAGLIKLLAPPFSCSDSEPGYIKGYVPGVRENGGQYTHAAAWVIMAFAKLGKGDKAWELFELINPINHTSNARECSRYKVEPYVMAADVYAVHPHDGRGGWTWYTGSAGWMYRAGLEYILGFQKNGSTVIMDPCIPSKWKEYSIKYRYKETTYNIVVKNPDSINKGVKSITIDEKIFEGNVINLINDGNVHEVKVMMG